MNWDNFGFTGSLRNCTLDTMDVCDPFCSYFGGCSCFSYGTVFLIEDEDGKPVERKLEDIKYGDKVLVREQSKSFDQSVKLGFETVVYVDLDPPKSGVWYNLYTLILQNGKSLSLTERHKVPTVTKDNVMHEKRVDALLTGEIVAYMDETGSLSHSPVT